MHKLTVFSMLGYANSLIRVPLLALCLLVVAPSAGWATNFQVLDAETRLHHGVYLVDADIDFKLSAASREALENSVPLTMQLTLQVRKQRNWLWDQTVANLEQRYQLQYQSLAQQYVVTNLNSHQLHSFPTYAAAIEYMGRLRAFPLLDQTLLDADTRYEVRLRAELDISSLPAPLRPVAYVSNAWRLRSDWYRWTL